MGAVAPPSGADSGRVCISTNFGQSWKTNIITLDWSAVACSADGSRFVAGAGGFDFSSRQVYAFVNSDESWVTMGDSLLSCRSLASSADGTRWVMAAGKIYTFVTEPTFPSATTLPAQAVRSDATLNATGESKWRRETAAWFEWGTGTNYGGATSPVSVGNGWTNFFTDDHDFGTHTQRAVSLSSGCYECIRSDDGRGRCGSGHRESNLLGIPSLQTNVICRSLTPVQWRTMFRSPSSTGHFGRRVS